MCCWYVPVHVVNCCRELMSVETVLQWGSSSWQQHEAEGGGDSGAFKPLVW